MIVVGFDAGYRAIFQSMFGPGLWLCASSWIWGEWDGPGVERTVGGAHTGDAVALVAGTVPFTQ